MNGPLDRSRIELSPRRFWPNLSEGQKRLREATRPSETLYSAGSTELLFGRSAPRLGLPVADLTWAIAITACAMTACAAHSSSARIGVSEPAPESVQASQSREATTQAQVPANTRPPAVPRDAAVPEPLPDREQVHRERELALADALLQGTPTPPEQLGLVLVLGQRAADLYWTFAIENRGAEAVRLSADLRLLELTLTPKASAEAATPTAPFTCNPLTKSPSNETGELLPGEAEVFSFDPRSICPTELLTEGTTVSGIFGYTIEKQLKWERGKRAEVALADKPPFVAELRPSPLPPSPLPTAPAAGPSAAPAAGPSTEASAPHKKQLFMPPMVLDQTYPLDTLSLFADGDPNANSASNVADLPLAVSIKDIGEARTPRFHLVNVTLRNTSPAPLDIVVRRELLTFEVVGPSGATICYLEPTQVDPLAHNFTRLEAGASRALATRMPEICPAGTFGAPGQYSVFVRYRSPSSGAEFAKQGFVGEVRSRVPAHLYVPDPIHNRNSSHALRRPAPKN